jgi:glycosyltransferase involved in cell wall biosynthesis
VKALHITYRFGGDSIGGAEHYMAMLSRALVRAGIEVDLWTTRTRGLPPISRFGVRWDNARPARGEHLHGVDVRRYTTFNLPEPLVRAFDRLLTARWRREAPVATGASTTHHDDWVAHLRAGALARPWLFEALFFLLRAPLAPGLLWDLTTKVMRYDVVLAQMTPYSTLNYAVAFGARAGVPVVLLPHFHLDDDFYHLRHYYHAFRGATAVLAFSLSQKTFFEGVGARAEVIGGGGVDPEEFGGREDSGDAFRRRLGVGNVPLILFVGRKAGSKRYDLVIEAVDFLNEQLACKLVMIGPDEDRRPISSPNVVYLGPQERAVVLDAYGAADVFAMMSESESFGMVFLEAWMAGKPVIGNRACSAVADLIADGQDGFLCGDALECAEKIAALILDGGLARRLGERGHDKAMREYTWDAIGEKVAAIYARVSREGPA